MIFPTGSFGLAHPRRWSGCAVRMSWIPPCWHAKHMSLTLAFPCECRDQIQVPVLGQHFTNPALSLAPFMAILIIQSKQAWSSWLQPSSWEFRQMDGGKFLARQGYIARPCSISSPITKKPTPPIPITPTTKNPLHRCGGTYL